MSETKCLKCDGCGRVADTEEQEPWTAWTRLSMAEGVAVVMGLIRPMTCPACGGSGSARPSEATP